MIRIIKKAGTQAPDILRTVGADETQSLIDSYNAGNTDLKFDSGIYGHAKVKNWLITLQSYKCVFCESKIGHISFGDVEHYRPKGGWVQDDEPLNKPGYFWLAYNWENLMLSCQLCNQRFKKNYFPLLDNAFRATPAARDISNEQPVFIHPVNEDPELFISFKEEIPVAINSNFRGEQTIKKLGLDRELLNEQRRAKLNPIRDLYNIAKGIPQTYEELKKEARAVISKYFNASKSDETEYASMLRSFFKANPIDF